MKEIPTKMSGYAIGQQDFKTLRERGSIYVDKTEFIHKIVESGSQYYFLARPRRFGKSLFLSTLRYFFEGRKELFKGLYIDSTGWEWEEYPVLRLDLNTNRYDEPGKLEVVLDNLFRSWEERYGVSTIADDFSPRFQNIIETAHEKTGRKVVILVDEYDKPLVGNLNKMENFEHYRSKLASLYSNFKSSAEHILLVFLTGVSRFSKLSVFSDLNNLKDITFTDEYADICGITEKELLEYFQAGIEKLARKERVDYDGALRLLKRNYDGYRFAAEGNEIYNPWSLLNAMDESRIGNYWNDTGMPTIIAEALKRVDADLEEAFDCVCEDDVLKGLDLLNPEPTALLYQTGYLTIKKYYRRLNQYRLGIPNNEVKKGLYTFLLPYYISTKQTMPNRNVSDMVRHFIMGDPDKAMRAMQAFFAGIDYKLKMENENNFHNAFYLLTHIIGLNTETEVHTSDGSIDIKIETEDYIYVIELKYNHSPENALRQIKEKHYGRPWQTDSREVYLIGTAFSSQTRCIEGWKIEKLDS
ncbi:MAG: ATP-binding protein [Muribaculaceae bacterium]|nr:ATP-binding protein [Muribaculaceae bacterium]